MFEEMVGWAVEGGADMIIGETFDDAGEALAALEVAKASGLPVVLTIAPMAMEEMADGVGIVSGPRKQFMPTTSAPACSSRWQVSTMPTPSAISSIAIGAIVRTTGRPLAFATSSAASASPA